MTTTRVRLALLTLIDLAESASTWMASRRRRPATAVGRIGRAGHLLDAAVEAKLADHGLSRWSWDVLAALRRSGPPIA